MLLIFTIGTCTTVQCSIGRSQLEIPGLWLSNITFLVKFEEQKREDTIPPLNKAEIKKRKFH